MNWHGRISKVVRHWNCDTNIDVLPYTPEEFDEKKREICIVQQEIRVGVEV